MSSRKERALARSLLVLVALLFLFKGWAFFRFVQGDGTGDCLAEVAAAPPGAVRTADAPVPDAGALEEPCRGELSQVIQQIEHEREALQQRARSLEEREAALEIYEQEVEERIGRLARLRAEILGLQGSITEQHGKNEEQMVKIFQSMEPEDAARHLENLDDQTASLIVMRMNPRQAAQILGATTPKKAARIVTRSDKTPPASPAPTLSQASVAGSDKTPPASPAPTLSQASVAGSEKTPPASPAPTLSQASVAGSDKAPPEPQESSASPPQADAVSPASKILQVGAFRSVENAETEVQRLKEKGYPSYRSETPSNPDPKKAFYGVFVGPLPAEEAQRVKGTLEQEHNYKGILTRPHVPKQG